MPALKRKMTLFPMMVFLRKYGKSGRKETKRFSVCCFTPEMPAAAGPG